MADPLTWNDVTVRMLYEVFIKGPEWLGKNIKQYEYPCLILHGGDDRSIPPEASKWLYRNISSQDKEIKIYDGLYHAILEEKERDTIIEDIHIWIENRIK